MRTNGAVGMVVVAMITGCAHGVDSAPSRAWVGTQPVASQDAVVSADRRPGESKNATSPKKPAEAPGLVAQNEPALVSRSGEVSARLVRLMSGHAVHPVPRAPPLALHAWFKDPVFGTCIRRITVQNKSPDS